MKRKSRRPAGKTHVPALLQGLCRRSWSSPQQRLCAPSWQQTEIVNGKKAQGEEVYTLRKYLFQMAGLLRWFMGLIFEHLHEMTREEKEKMGNILMPRLFVHTDDHQPLLSFELSVRKIIACLSFPAGKTRTS